MPALPWSPSFPASPAASVPAPPALRPASLIRLAAPFWILLDFAAALSVSAAVVGTDSAAATVPFALLVTLFGHVFGLHDANLERDRLRLALCLTVVIAGSAAALAFLTRWGFLPWPGQEPLASAALLAWAALYLPRVAHWHLTSRWRTRVCLLGSPAFCEEAARQLEDAGVPGEIHRVSLNPEAARRFPEAELTVQTLPDALPRLVPDIAAPGGRDFVAWAAAHRIDEVAVEPSAFSRLPATLLRCLDEGIPVVSYREYVERRMERVLVEQLDTRWFLESGLRGLDPCYLAFKRGGDLVLSLLGMVAAAPLLALAALAIRLEGSGPVFYSQIRVGQNGRPFRIHKLRTMSVDAEAGGARWAERRDPRVTAVGKILRKTRLDELPQFWNILKGDMSFIGPRPERPEFVSGLAERIPFYPTRHLAKPGLTGWAQINYPYGAGLEDARNKLRYDLYYLKHASPELDLHILIRTAGAVMKGAR
jgi:exopolysaccharide biosynthesis polyprenyl glycosylphosphotransferase